MASKRQTAIRTPRLFEFSELLDEEPSSPMPGPGDAVARPALPARRPSPGRGSGQPSPSR